MADVVFNIAKGKIGYYASLPAANDALILIVLETASIEADSVLIDYDNVSVLLAAATNEQTTMGRKTITSGHSVNVDDTNDRVEADFGDPIWASATGNAFSKLLVAYDPDTTTGTDADLIPLVALDFSGTPAGGNITFALHANGFWRST